MDQWFDEIVGASEDGRIDSKAEVLAEAFRRMRERDPEFSAEDVVLIGDTRLTRTARLRWGLTVWGFPMGSAPETNCWNTEPSVCLTA